MFVLEKVCNDLQRFRAIFIGPSVLVKGKPQKTKKKLDLAFDNVKLKNGVKI